MGLRCKCGSSARTGNYARPVHRRAALPQMLRYCIEYAGYAAELPIKGAVSAGDGCCARPRRQNGLDVYLPESLREARSGACPNRPDADDLQAAARTGRNQGVEVAVPRHGVSDQLEPIIRARGIRSAPAENRFELTRLDRAIKPCFDGDLIGSKNPRT